MEKKIEAKIKFVEDLIGRPLEEYEKKLFIFYCEYLEGNPRLSFVMARGNGHHSAMAMYIRGDI